MHGQPIKYGPKPAAPRDGDKTQAQRRVNHLVAAGRLAHPSTLLCTDCGRPAHDYDHYLGYDAAHHLDVQAVCRSCHMKRGIARGEFTVYRRPRQVECVVCGVDRPPFRHGRCDRCRQYFNRTGRERPT